MKVPVLNAEGESVRTQDVLARFEHRRIAPSLLHQAVVRELANVRIPRAHTKGRGEIRGGGRKPWRQKGTGRARHGSIRSPLWRGGGVVFGPRTEETYRKRMPARMRQQALALALVTKARDQELRMVEALPATSKTKELVTFLKHCGLQGSVLLVPPRAQLAGVRRAARNIRELRVADPTSVSTADVLRTKLLLATPESWTVLEGRL